MIELSRLTWAAARAETDNANEWLPAPGQTGVIGVDINDEQVEAWLSMLDESELILNGELLIPFGGARGQRCWMKTASGATTPKTSKWG